jgi:general stress protein 26
VYFPTTSIVPLLSLLENGASAEIDVARNQGFVGMSTFMGGRSTTGQAVVTRGGLGCRLPTPRVDPAFSEGAAVTRLLLHFSQALIAQIAQTAVCSRHHSLDQRLLPSMSACRSLAAPGLLRPDICSPAHRPIWLHSLWWLLSLSRPGAFAVCAGASWRKGMAWPHQRGSLMKTSSQASADLTHVSTLIEDIPIAMLTTVEADGALACRPMAVLEMDAQGALWFFTDLRSSKVEHLRVANLSFTDSGRATYVSLSGHGEIDTDRGRIQRLWTSFAKPWFPDGPDSTHLALLKFVPDAADYWDGPNSRMVRAFGAIVSVVAGKPWAMGEHGSHTGLSAPVSPGLTAE